MKPLEDCRLYTFVDFQYLHGRNPELIAAQLCDGGADLIQLRAKGAAPEFIAGMAAKLLRITSRAGVRLVLNDHWNLTVEGGIPLCHLGQEDFFDSGHSHRSDLRPESASTGLGLSTHAPLQAERAIAAGASYVAIGPVHATGTKPAARATGLDYARWAAANIRIPWFAIGGINLSNLDAVIGAGARRICVVAAILNSGDVTAACEQFQQRLRSLPA